MKGMVAACVLVFGSLTACGVVATSDEDLAEYEPLPATEKWSISRADTASQGVDFEDDPRLLRSPIEGMPD